MIKKIYIKNFATIDSLDIDFCGGLNVLSGETGAGKSIIIESINFLFGRAKGTDIIRTGEKEGFVSAAFDAAGGPIVQPDMDAFILTPICPHTLSNRPLIINPCELRVKILPQERDIFISADGRDGLKLYDGDEIVIKKHPSKVFLSVSLNFGYWDILRTKLNW